MYVDTLVEFQAGFFRERKKNCPKVFKNLYYAAKISVNSDFSRQTNFFSSSKIIVFNSVHMAIM